MQGRRVRLAVRPEPRRSGLCPGGARLPLRLRLGAGQPHGAVRLRGRPHRVRGGLLLRLAAGVGAALLHQPLLAPRQFDPAGELVLGDGPLVLHRDGPPLVRRPVRLLLDQFPRRGPQRPLHLRLGPHGHDPHRHHLDTGVRQAGLRGEALRVLLPHRGDAAHQRLGQRGAGEGVERVLLRDLGQQGGELLQRGTAPRPGVRVDGEVQPRGGGLRAADAEGDRGLHGHVLEVGGPGVEGHRQLTVVDRHLRQGGGQRPVPEADARPLVDEAPAPEVADVRGGRGAQVAPSEAPADVGHDRPPCCRQRDDKGGPLSRQGGRGRARRRRPGPRPCGALSVAATSVRS